MERRQKLFLLALGVLWLLLFASPAWAGDCSGPDDCGAIPDNATKAGTTIAVATGAAVAGRKKKDDDITYGSGDASDLDAIFGAPNSTPDPSTTDGGPSGGDGGGSAPDPKATSGGKSPEADPGKKTDDIFNRPLGE